MDMTKHDIFAFPGNGLDLGTILERDIDMLLLEELHASPNFRSFLLELTGRETGWRFKDGKASVIRDGQRESDLEVQFSHPGGEKLRLLVETKIDARYQPRQLEDYMKRAALYEQQDPDLQAAVLLIAPESYSREHDDKCRRISLEEIRTWFETSDLSSERKNYKISLLSGAIEKQKQVHDFSVKNPDDHVTGFWLDHWNLVRELAPEFRMKRPSTTAGTGSGYRKIAFVSDLPSGSQLVHKIHRYQGRSEKNLPISDYVDLQFSRTSVNELEERYGAFVRQARNDKRIHKSVEIVSAGKSASIRVHVPYMALTQHGCQKSHNGSVLVGDCILADPEAINRSSQRPLTGKNAQANAADCG